MTQRTQEWDILEDERQSGNLNFALDSPKAAVTSGSGGGDPRPEESPQQRIEEFRAIYNSDPHVGEAVDKLVDYLVGSGFSIHPRNVPYTDTDQTNEDIAELKELIELSDFDEVLVEWVRRAVIDGTAFIELVWDEETNEFNPTLLPTLDVSIVPDEYGNDGGYELDVEGEDEPIEYEKYEIAALRFHQRPTEMWGRSFIERAQEQADMLRDMEIDLARFISTKAYPPILWKLGDSDNNIHWSEDQVDGWLDTVEQVEPDSMLAAGDDVEHEVVGTTSTSSSQGVMNLQSTFTHLETRMATAFGLPAFLLNTAGQYTADNEQAQMPSFDRRVQKLRVYIQNAVERQIFRSIMGHPDPEEYNELLPRFEFGEHSSEEERLETDEALKLFNNGFLTREAFAERVGIDPEREMPDENELMSEIVPIIQELAGSGDSIQNEDGGHPTDTGGGADSAGGEVTNRESEGRAPSDDDSRNERDVHNE